MRQNCSAPVRVRRQPETFCRYLDHPYFAFGRVVVERNPRVHGEPQVIIVPLQQAAGEGVVSFLQVGGAGRGRPCRAEAGSRPEGVLGLEEHPGWIDAVQGAVAGERGVHQVLHGA